MGLPNVINNLARIYNKYLMTLITLIIFILLLSAGFDPDEFSFGSATGILILSLWILFVLISAMYTLNGFLINTGFKNNVRKFELKGKPVRGIRGFGELLEALAGARNLSLMITLAAILSFTLFVLTPVLSSAGLQGRTFASFAITMAFISLSVVFLIELPEETALDPGGLTGFYEPDMFPIVLDNILSDVFLTYLDPITYMEIDEYMSLLGEMLEPEFESDENLTTRIERAFEKILIIAYLSNSIPEVMNKDIIRREVTELIGEKNFDEFYAGNKTGLSWTELTRIVQKVAKEAPEAFTLVDRLLINLTDNYNQFTSKNLYFTVSAATNQGSIKESAGAIVFFLNNTDQEDRIMEVVFDSDINSIHPNHQKIRLGLDAQTDPYPDQQPEFIAEGEDILNILSTILQVGDAVWFRFKPAGFGFKLVKIHAEEAQTGKLMGTSMEMKFTKSISWYVKQYIPKLSALGGLAMPFIQSLLFAA